RVDRERIEARRRRGRVARGDRAEIAIDAHGAEVQVRRVEPADIDESVAAELRGRGGDREVRVLELDPVVGEIDELQLEAADGARGGEQEVREAERAFA